MKITKEILSGLNCAVRHCGSAGAFARRTGVDAANVSRYLNGKVKSVSDDNWAKMLPLLAPVLPAMFFPAASEPIPVVEFEALHRFLENGGASAPAGTVRLPLSWLAGRRPFALIARNLGMEPLFQDGDLLLVDSAFPPCEIPDGGVVVARLRNRTVCRHISRHGTQWLFAGADPGRGGLFAVPDAELLWLGFVIGRVSRMDGVPAARVRSY